MTHHTARILALRANGIGRRLGCACCNVPRRWLPTYGRIVRARMHAFDRRDLARNPP